MATKLFVGNIPYSVNSDGLRDIFAKVGEVAEANVVTDRETGRSRGFGFVEMKADADAKKAIDTLNGTEVDGRKIFVSEAREKAPRDNQQQ
ncbi:MAG: RNP-1 like protein RNA-binding protein [Candidatus Curtissbacteria bacterium GW2011_GWA1_41_11]|uniref:RNP-1 like protein RNA-binding protein n=1 Tax=Candidatus Curtissbacteria bacterium GW2011_GWA1_41_11 TaxID=1618409 RepID=A0A0G0UGD4_9BACT|nr:MAG: RNP-1 like protein RNA-binding protein [Candidatus Curtissbacteria bacterium GW2011_GWA1_41_11]